MSDYSLSLPTNCMLHNEASAMFKGQLPRLVDYLAKDTDLFCLSWTDPRAIEVLEGPKVRGSGPVRSSRRDRPFGAPFGPLAISARDYQRSMDEFHKEQLSWPQARLDAARSSSGGAYAVHEEYHGPDVLMAVRVCTPRNQRTVYQVADGLGYGKYWYPYDPRYAPSELAPVPGQPTDKVVAATIPAGTVVGIGLRSVRVYPESVAVIQWFIPSTAKKGEDRAKRLPFSWRVQHI